jgi:hypothetical protein
VISGHRSKAQSIAFRPCRLILGYTSITEMHISEETEMDEYTFLVLAKLKADRRRLAREAATADPSASGIRTSYAAQHATLPQPERSEARNNYRKHLRHTRVVRDFEWREQS